MIAQTPNIINKRILECIFIIKHNMFPLGLIRCNNRKASGSRSYIGAMTWANYSTFLLGSDFDAAGGT